MPHFSSVSEIEGGVGRSRINCLDLSHKISKIERLRITLGQHD